MYKKEAVNPLYDPQHMYQYEEPVKREVRSRPDKMDLSDIAGAKPQSKIRALGRPPMHSGASGRPVEQQPKPAMQQAGFNIISHQPGSSSSQTRSRDEQNSALQHAQY